MTKSNSKGFSEQIGGLGGEETTVGSKLRNLPGQPSQLTEEENNEMQQFLKRSNDSSRLSREDRDTTPISQGWIPISRDEMGDRSSFYPEDWEFRVRPATVEAIKYWSSIDEDRQDAFLVINNVFNEVVKNCVSIVGANGSVAWNKINSWDRLWFVLKVREYTFAKGEANIEFEEECHNCGKPITYRLNSQSLIYEFPDQDIIKNHWDAEKRCWNIDPKEYDVNAAMVTLYVPTLEKDSAILQWVIEKARDKKSVDEVFLRFLPWMLSKAPKDDKILDNFIKDCERVYKSWNVEMFDFMDEVVRNISVDTSEKLSQVCPHCGEEDVSDLKFPSGVKALFQTERKHKRFGSR